MLSPMLSPVQIPKRLRDGAMPRWDFSPFVSLLVFWIWKSFPGQGKPIDTVSNSCLIDKETTFGIKPLDSIPNSTTYCVILDK